MSLILTLIQNGGLFSLRLLSLSLSLSLSLFLSFSNDRVLCVYAPSGHSTREQLTRGHFFEGLQNYMENKSEESGNEVILEDFNCSMDKIDRDGRK